MPRRYKKKPYRKRRYRKKRSSTTGIGRLPFPKKFLFKTRYVESDLTLNPGAGGLPAVHVFRLTSLNDIDFTGIGHQPIGYDQIMPMYDHYTVIGAKIKVRFTNTDDGAFICLLQLKDDSGVSLNTNQVIENGLCTYTTVNAAGGSDIKQLNLNFSARKFFGRNVVDSQTNQGLIGTNPVENAFLHVIVDPMTAGDAGIIRCCVEIELIAILSEPKELGQS